jgi:hypothetical protein
LWNSLVYEMKYITHNIIYTDIETDLEIETALDFDTFCHLLGTVPFKKCGLRHKFILHFAIIVDAFVIFRWLISFIIFSI